MIISITKSARKFGYIIWSEKTNGLMKELIGDRKEVAISFNGLLIGIKPIDWKYHRISIGYKFTRALPDTATKYNISFNNELLEVKAING